MTNEHPPNDDGLILADILDALAGDVALAFSHQAEDVVVLHLLKTHARRPVEVFTLDTQKLFPQTEAYHAAVERFFALSIHRVLPAPEEIGPLEADLGPWGMRHSLENRHRCCDTRKVAPLKRALAGKSAWITGLRAAQSVTRTALQRLEYDETHRLIKINPIASWSEQEVFDYVACHGLPLHPLYGEGFRSIGCAPCTRAVGPDEDLRAGRWWWENPEHKECGLHLRPATAPAAAFTATFPATFTTPPGFPGTELPHE
ncbi:MAG: phosphoadenylyl-sulfate reductase [Zoogloeaceae bacterium]|jgi:phosphoadenosine phosphosulfate reductase|nr:phosphoadenylyl-sulfate reductase [Zoogloeaceae bacterium]